MESFGINSVFKYMELLLDSRDTTRTQATAQFISSQVTATYTTSWPKFYLTSKSYKPVAIKLLQAEIPFVWDLIDEENNMFTLVTDDTRHLITLPTGSPTGHALAEQLTDVISQHFPCTVTWNPTLLKFTFTKTGGPTVWGFDFQGYSFAQYAGFFNSLLTTDAQTIVSPSIATITGPFYLYLNSQTMGPLIQTQLSDDSPDQGNGLQIARIPINVQPGSVVFYNDPDPQKYFDFFAENELNSVDLYWSLGTMRRPLNLKGAGFSVKLGLLVYRDASHDINSKPSFGGVGTRIVP